MFIEMNAGDLKEVIRSVEATQQDEGVLLLKEDKWLMKAVGDATVLMFATLVPEDAMIEYEKGDTDEVGIRLSDITDMIDDTSDPITLELENKKLIIEHGGYEASVPTIDPSVVSGVARQSPDADHCVSFDMDFSRFTSFLSKADNVADTGHYFMSAREDGLYLYAEHDNSEVRKRYAWDSMDNVAIDFAAGQSPPQGGHDPAVDAAVDTILALDFTQRINEIASTARFHIDNHYPVKFVFETESGIKGSYILSPRMPGGDSMVTPPDRVTTTERQSVQQ